MMWIGLTIVVTSVLVVAIQLLRLKGQPNRYATYWNDQNQAVLQSTEPLTYVALGDSTAQGVGATRTENGYVSLLRDDLASKTGRPVRLINLSVSGAKLADVAAIQLPRLQQVALTSDTLITLAIGANDMRTYDAETFSKQLETIFSRLPPQTIVADIPYFGGGRLRAYEKNAQAANVIIREVAAKYGLKRAPLYEITKRRDSLKAYAIDLFHPSNTGYRNWYDAFKEVL